MKKNVFLSILIFLATGLFAGGAAYLYGKAYIEIVRITIAALLGSGIVLFLHAEGREKGSLLHDNIDYFDRFTGFYFIGLIAALLFPLLPESGWPFLVIFIVMGLSSNQLVGICAGSTLLMISVLLQDALTASVFFTYFLSGAVGIILFSYIDETFRVGLPFFISMLLNLVCIAVNVVMMGQTSFGFETLFIVFSNILVCVLVLLVFLRFYSTHVIHRNRNKYMEINDPECPILVELKQKSLSEYYQAVHTAYLSDKIAKKLNLDDMATKTCGYYHKIGTLKGENSWEAINEICREYRFPNPAISLLKEYTDRETALMSKEAVVVLFADTLVASLLYLFSKDPTVKPDYNHIIEAIYDRKFDSGIIDKTLITMGEMKEIRKMLKEEHLYYDFLR
jgi:membrane-associated HD superfamily phosphohydrolase